MTASPEWFRDDDGNRLAPDDPRVYEFTRRAVRWTKDTFGEANVIALAVHHDETTPHVHAIVTPIRRDQRGKVRLSASHWMNGTRKLSALQDSFAEAMAPLGLQRGARGTCAKHVTISRMYERMEANAQAAEAAAQEAEETLHRARKTAGHIAPGLQPSADRTVERAQRVARQARRPGKERRREPQHDA
jgi:hypothetical protein